MESFGLTEKVNWRGNSGKVYIYNIHKIGTKFRKFPGNYIVAQETDLHRWKPIYIGQTEDMSQDFDTNPKFPCIQQNQATHILVHRNENGKRARLVEETDLVNKWHPVCNIR